MANFTVRNDVLVDFNSHNSLVANEIYKGYGGKWIKVSELSQGIQIAVFDDGIARWETITDILVHSSQHVYDLEI